MRRFVERNRGEAVRGGGFRAFLPIEWRLVNEANCFCY